MKAGPPVLTTLFARFAVLSMLAFGGANTVVPEMHREAVQVAGWMTDAEFASLFAIAQASPGPNFMIATLVGWKAAGLPGAIVATVAMCLPSCLLTYWVARVWDRHGDSLWRRAIADGLTPVTVGMVASTAWILARGADRDVGLAMVTTATAAIAYLTRINPLWCLAAAAALGLLGLL